MTICVCPAPGATPSNKLRQTVGTKPLAAESGCFIRAVISGASISAGIAVALASPRSLPSGELPKNYCNSTGLDWFKPVNFGTPNFGDDGSRAISAERVGQECPTSAIRLRRTRRLAALRHPLSRRASGKYPRQEITDEVTRIATKACFVTRQASQTVPSFHLQIHTQPIGDPAIQSPWD